MSRLQEKYSGCRPATEARGGRLATPATFETPEDLPRENDPRRPQGAEGSATPATPGGGGAQGEAVVEQEKKKQSLDDFLANHTRSDR